MNTSAIGRVDLAFKVSRPTPTVTGFRKDITWIRRPNMPLTFGRVTGHVFSPVAYAKHEESNLLVIGRDSRERRFWPDVPQQLLDQVLRTEATVNEYLKGARLNSQSRRIEVYNRHIGGWIPYRGTDLYPFKQEALAFAASDRVAGDIRSIVGAIMSDYGHNAYGCGVAANGIKLNPVQGILSAASVIMARHLISFVQQLAPCKEFAIDRSLGI